MLTKEKGSTANAAQPIPTEGNNYDEGHGNPTEGVNSIAQDVDDDLCAECGENDFCDCLPIGRDLAEVIAECDAGVIQGIALTVAGLGSGCPISPPTNALVGNLRTYETVNEERNRLAVEEIDHRRERLDRDRRRWAAYDAPADSVLSGARQKPPMVSIIPIASCR